VLIVIEQIENGHNPFQYHFTDEVPFEKHKVRKILSDKAIDRIDMYIYVLEMQSVRLKKRINPIHDSFETILKVW